MSSQSLQLNALTDPQKPMPSDYAISAWVRGEPGATWRVAALTAMRCAFIAPGFWVAGVRGRQLVLGSVASSIGITLGIALLKLVGEKQHSTPQPAPDAIVDPATPQ